MGYAAKLIKDYWGLTPFISPFFTRFCGALVLFAALGFSHTALADSEPESVPESVPGVAENRLSCAGARYRNALNCNAGEFVSTVTITNEAGLGSPVSCNFGDYVTLIASVMLHNSHPDRYNIGFFTGENGNDPRLTGGTCSVATFPKGPPPWLDLDHNKCGDYMGGGDSTNVVRNIKVLCAGDANGQLKVPYVVTYQQNAGNSSSCTGPKDVTSGSPSKCNYGLAGVNVTVNGTFGVAKSFSPSTIATNDTSTLTITLTNPSSTAITGVTFSDNYPSGLVNTSTLIITNSCGGTVTAVAGGSSLALTGGTIPGKNGNENGNGHENGDDNGHENGDDNGHENGDGNGHENGDGNGHENGDGNGNENGNGNGSCSVTVKVTSATAGSYPNSTGTVTTSNAGTGAAANATLTVVAATFGAFNACEVAGSPNAACTNKTTATTSRIYTKVAGLQFNLALVALKPDGSRNTSYNKPVIVELLDASSGGVRDVYNCGITTWPVIATLSPNPTFATNGLLTVGPFNVPNVYKDVRVRITESGSTTVIGCSTDNFAIRPVAPTLNVSPTMAIVTPPPTHLASASPTIKAKASFTLSATTSPAAGYAGTLTLDNSKLTAQTTTQDTTVQIGGAVGTLTPTSLTANPLTSPSNNATYSEVGYLYLAPGAFRDDTFTAVDSATGDCIIDTTGNNNLSDSLVGTTGKYGCSIGNEATVSFGRFVPDHFITAVVQSATGVPMPCPTGLTCPALYNGFVYSGEPFSMQVTARNAGGGTTQNYQGAFAKQVTLSAVGSIGGAAITNASPGGVLSANTIAANAFTLGSNAATLANPVFTFATTPTAPTDVYVRAIETTGVDGVSSLRLTNPTTTSVEGGIKVVSGRFKIPNVYGSEQLPLPMAVLVQYYDGTYWTTSLTDSATPFPVISSIQPVFVNGDHSINIHLDSVDDACASTVFCNGVKNITLTDTNHKFGTVRISLDVPSYLLVGSGLATFGVFKSPLIYRRENY